jgi:threonine dehydratase
VIAVEPVGKDLSPCLKEGKRLWPNPPQFLSTIAEGIMTQQAGQLTFPILCDLVEKDTLTITDQEMIRGMKIIAERMKLVTNTMYS